jgi:hypothetical protein
LKRLKTYPISVLIISFLLILPFIIMELVNRRAYNEGFPFSLFIGFWILALIFSLALATLVHSVRAGEGLLAHPIRLILLVSVMAVSAWLWTGFLADQMPCFMGVPVCD